MKVFYQLFLVISLFLASCGKIQSLVYKKVDGVDLGQLFSNSIIKLNLLCYNPNRWGVTLKKADCKIFVDSVYIGQFVFDSSIHISALKDFMLPISIKVDGQQILEQGLQALGKEHIWLKLVGNSTLKKAGVRFKVPIYYEGKQKIQI